ncbi:hypothetical protein [Micromonospora sp. KLBMP9576]|uniref:hypothetical protein n=1 Tax=Micromonospora sp. KLBMP9576 TaxID=3424769 RepID=UPI003D8A51B9
MAETKINPAGLRKAAKEIGDLVDAGAPAFRQLKESPPNAGSFDMAKWLEFVYEDRANAIVEHVRHLQLACTEIADGLKAIADNFEDVDETNADAVATFDREAKKAVTDMSDAEFEVKKSETPPDFDSGDDAETGDTGAKIVGDRVILDDDAFGAVRDPEDWGSRKIEGLPDPLDFSKVPFGVDEGGQDVVPTRLDRSNEPSEFKP